MRRIGIRVAAALAACAVLATPALARVIEGTNGPDKLIGSKNGDRITGKRGGDIIRSAEGADRIFAGGGNDFVRSGRGFDEIRTGRRDDEIDLRDGGPDLIDCGPGNDKVFVDRVEEGIFDCERVKEEKR